MISMDRSYNNPFGENVPTGGQPGGSMFSGAVTNSAPMEGASTNQTNVSISSGKGDIVLDTGGGKKSSKTGLIIGVVVIVLLAIVGLVVGIMLMGKGNESDGDNTQKVITVKANSLDDKIYLFANYLVSGKETVDLINIDYDPNYEYAVKKALEDRNMEYYEKLEVYWDSVVEGLSNSGEIGEKDRFDTMIDLQNDIMGFMRKLVEVNDLTSGEVLALYNGKRKDGAEKAIEENYLPFKEIGYYAADAYADAKVAEAKAMVDLYDKYYQGGCVMEGKVDEKCATNLTSADEARAKLKKASTDNNLDNPSTIASTMILNVQNLMQAVSGETNSEEDDA